MTKRARGTLAALAAVLAMIVSGVGVAADARRGVGPFHVWHVADLSVSSHPAGADWLDGRVLHTASGGVRTLPWTSAAARSRHLRLVGHTARGWLVKDFANTSWRVWLVRGTHREKLSSTGVSEGAVVSVVVSTNQRRYVVSDFDGGATSLVTVRDLHGATVASRTFDGDGAVLDLSGSQAVIGTTASVLWLYDDPDHPGTGSTTDLGWDAVAASLATDQLLVKDPETGEVGRSTIIGPSTPTWWVPIVDPRISPDGYLMIGRTDPTSDWVDLRSMTSSGNLLQRIEVDYLSNEALRWTTSQAYVLIGATGTSGDRERLVRCTAAGHCRGQSGVRPRDRISLPPR